MRNTLLFVLLLFTALLSAQTIEKSQSIMIFDVVPTVAPCTFCSERAFVRADNTEYYWDGDSWEKWYDGNAYLTALVQDSIIVTTRFGVEVDRDTVRVPGMGGGSPGLADSMLVVRDSLAAIRGDIETGSVETITSSDGNLSFDATDPANIVATNNAPDQTVSLTGAGSVGVTGTYPSFTVTGNAPGDFFINADSTWYQKLKQDRIFGSGAVIIRTGIEVTSTNQEIAIRVPYFSSNSGAANRVTGEFTFFFKIVSSAIDRPRYLHIGALTQTLNVRYALESNRVVVILGETTDGSIDIVHGFQAYSQESLKISGVYSTQKATSLGALSPVTVTGLSPTFVPGVQQSLPLSGSYFTAFTLINNGAAAGTGIRMNMIPSTQSPSSTTYTQNLGASIGSRLFSSQFYLTFNTPLTPNVEATERMVIDNTGNVGIGTPTPGYLLSVNTTGGVRLGSGTTAQRGIGIASYLGWNTTTGAWDTHNGTSFGRIYPSSDVTPTNGQIKVFNSTTGLYVPTTLTTGMNNWTLAADTGTPASITNATTATIAGSAQGIDVAMSGNTATVSLDYSEVTATTTLSGNEFFQLYDVISGNQQVHIDTLVSYMISQGLGNGIYGGSGTIPEDAVVTQPNGGTITFDGSTVTWDAVELNISAGTPIGIEGGISFSSGAIQDVDASGGGDQKITVSDMGVFSYSPDDRLLEGDMDGLAIGLGSVVVSDGTTILTSDGAGIEFDADIVNLIGIEVRANGQLIPMQDTLVIPVYAAPYDQAPTADDDYRGWRVPADLDGARIIGIQYSFDTPGSGTVLAQLGNGAVNIGGGTIAIAGYVDVSANRELVTGELWRPALSTISGSGHLGFMFQLIIERQ